MPDAVARTVLASLALHAALMAGAIAWRSTSSAPPVEAEIPFEYLTPGEFEAITAPAPRPAENAGAAVAGPVRAVPPVMIQATRLLSASALADPRSREARAMLPTFNGTERMVQLCNLEAMEQVHAARPDLRPERIVAYALADLSIRGATIAADGAAFRSGGR